MWNLFLACAYSNFTRTRCGPILFISFLVSVGSNEHHSCESRQIITRRRLKMEIIVKSIVEIRTRVNSAAKVSYQQVYSSGLYTSIMRTIQTEQTPVSTCFSLSQPQNNQKKIQRMVIKLGFLMLQTIVTIFCFWQGPNLRPSVCQDDVITITLKKFTGYYFCGIYGMFIMPCFD